jgi:ornithine cyclodeaminase/alanine dehydrogenase-like protein (mu-crystallin family)
LSAGIVLKLATSGDKSLAETLLLTRSDIRQVVAWPALFDAVRDGLLRRAKGQTALPVSGQIAMPTALLHLKAGAIFDPGALSVKANLRPTGGHASGVVVLYDTEAGQVSAILDSADITAMRTAALAAVAAERLAAPGRPVHLAVLGAGPLAAQVLAALPQRLEIASTHLWSRVRARAEALTRQVGVPARIYDTPGEAARQANVIVTATPARTPYLEAGDIADGALILAMGADSPGKRELAPSVLEAAQIIADQREDVLKVGESAYLPADDTQRIVAELGALLADDSPLPAPAAQGARFRVFDSVGSAIIDATVSRSLVALAKANGLGQVFDFGR